MRGWPASTGRSAGGCCSSPAGGAWRSREIRQAAARPISGMHCLFLLGAIVMRGAGCTLNDIADRDFDAQVARTRSRPIPSGQVSVKAAFVFLVAAVP